MNVSVTKQMEKMVRDLVKTGRYGSASEVVREGLRLVYEREVRLQELRELVREGEESGRREGWLDGEEVFRELKKKLARRKAEQAARSSAKPARRRAG